MVCLLIFVRKIDSVDANEEAQIVANESIEIVVETHFEM